MTERQLYEDRCSLLRATPTITSRVKTTSTWAQSFTAGLSARLDSDSFFVRKRESKCWSIDPLSCHGWGGARCLAQTTTSS